MTDKTGHLPLAHVLLAVAVAAVWGSNFAVIKIALAHLPPLLFATLRFTFAFLPAAFFVKRPAVPWSQLAAYGVLIGAGQFGVLYIAMERDISPGLASLVIQTQVFFTIGLSMWLSREQLRLFQVGALVMAAAGLALIMAHTGGEVTALGLVLTLFAALCWAGGNLVARASGTVNMLAYVVWSSAFSVPPLLALSLLFEGWPAIEAGLRNADALTWTAVLYQSFGNTLFGYGSWAWLMARHPTATISPFALLVPLFGMGTAAVVMGEPLQPWKLLAAALVMSGLALNIVWPRLRPALAR
ncbi:MAG TPA: EamA family transporter [Rhizomicrobium sp.]|nr:EamA family transporter [Rhizomicrobium sp.]